MIIIEMILMGIFVTYFMDFLAGVLVKRKIIHSLIKPEVIGRWFLSMFKGKFIHKDIHKTPELNNEKLWCFLSHYLIGIGLAGAYLSLELTVPALRDQMWMPLLFGIATILLPWFWLFPSMGFGFMASKSQNRSRIIQTSLVNHTNFGLGLLIWTTSFHQFFV
jgi:hypothetical protein